MSTPQKDGKVNKVKYTIKVPEEEEEPPTDSTAQPIVLLLSFLSAISSKYVCVLCHQLLRYPCRVTCCNSPYCRDCIKHLGAASGKCASEKCGKTYSIVVGKKEEELERKIRQIRVYCPMRENGCKWVGSVEDLETVHWTTSALDSKVQCDDATSVKCQYQELECPNLCGLSLPLWLLQEHRLNKCEKEMVACEYCGEEDSAAHIHSVHHLRCQSFPIQCPNQCGMPGIERHNIVYHVDEECPFRMVSCEYRHAGCIMEVQAIKLAEHNSEFAVEHLKLMSEKMRLVSRGNRHLRQKNEVLARHVEHLIEIVKHVSKSEYEMYLRMACGVSPGLDTTCEDLSGVLSELLGGTGSKSERLEAFQRSSTNDGNNDRDEDPEAHQYTYLLSSHRPVSVSYDRPVKSGKASIDCAAGPSKSSEAGVYEVIDDFKPTKRVYCESKVPAPSLSGVAAKNEKVLSDSECPKPLTSSIETENLPRSPLPRRDPSKENEGGLLCDNNGRSMQEKAQSDVSEGKALVSNVYQIPIRARSQSEASGLHRRSLLREDPDGVKEETVELPVPVPVPRSRQPRYSDKATAVEKPQVPPRKASTLPVSWQVAVSGKCADDAKGPVATVLSNLEEGMESSPAAAEGVYSVILPPVKKNQGLKVTPTIVEEEVSLMEKDTDSEVPPAIKPKPPKVGPKPGKRKSVLELSNSNVTSEWSQGATSAANRGRFFSCSEPGCPTYDTPRSVGVDLRASPKKMLLSKRNSVADPDFMLQLNSKLKNRI